MFNQPFEDEEEPRHIRQYRIIRKIGNGTFGDIFMAENAVDGHRVALKLEEIDAHHPQLLFEFKLYKLLRPGTGIPRVYGYYTESKYNVMVMDLLGPSLEDLFNFCSRRFSLKTVLMLASQMLDRIEFVHLKKFVHRDIKPENFVMGVGVKITQLFIIDFGLAKRYHDSELNAHIPFKWGNPMTGTARYASINALLGFEISRRDDMEALGYVLLYFLRGSLPWQGLKEPRHQKYEILAEKKQSIKPEELCIGLPDEFAMYLVYCRSIRFDKQPNYLGLRRSFNDLFKRLKYPNDNIYDWQIVQSFTDDDNTAIQGKHDIENKENEPNETA